jgi:hypothetical protein
VDSDGTGPVGPTGATGTAGASIIYNAATADGPLAANTASQFITGSVLDVPAGKLKMGSVFRYRMAITKTASGTTASTFLFKLGTNGTTADTTVCTFLLPTVGTAVADTAIVDMEVVCRGPLATNGVMQGMMRMTHNLATTGFLAIAAVALQTASAAFDVTTAGLRGSIAITTAANQTWTVRACDAELLNT